VNRPGRRDVARARHTTAGAVRSIESTRVAYSAHVERSALAPLSRTSYVRRVWQFLDWLEAQPEHAQALSEARARNWAVRDYRLALKDARRAPATINAALAAVDDLYGFLGLGAADAKRDRIDPAGPKALAETELRTLLRSIEAQGAARDRAIVALMAFAGLRVGEVGSLEVADVALTARTGQVRVRRGKGDVERTVPLAAEARAALTDWLRERGGLPGDPLFAGPEGASLTVRALHRAVASQGRRAGLAVTPHALRHTFVTRLVRQGLDLPLVAELAGHRSLETTRRYAAPTESDRQAAVELLDVEY
jgi:site-specific recombinase XerD